MAYTKGRNRIGARCLTAQEIKLILPTYGQIKKQIEQFRQEKQDNSQPGDQKTNNIGIIGVRGAGKTSVLKTIRTELESQRNERIREGECNDIILPIIVPENMSESSTLMATILGMLKETVHERIKHYKEQAKNRFSDCIGESKLEKDYNDVVKQYSYIQKEYRDILIQEYTTENDYVKSSAKVFSSDVEFIKKFNQLIDTLLNGENEENTTKKNALLFLFIDDIDLSTYRCADVVRTLLSYTSNQNIVTLLSGDLSTFEEALTLDFLRQEKVLDFNVIDKSMLISGEGLNTEARTLLESKKQLAYEYLKKILPPVYRHNIKEWSIEEKGNYGMFDSDEGGQSGETLSGLLSEALEGWIDPAFFSYAWQTDNGDIKTEAMPYTYHLFDNTSRGLNNVYNMLKEIKEKRKEGQLSFIEEKKQLLDTILSSKQLYNKYRDKIQGVMFRMDESEKTGKVFFDNAYAIIYKEEAGETDGRAQNVKGMRYSLEDPVERFSLFIFTDFAARILYEKNYETIKEDENYKNLKRKAMEDLFLHPVIAEKAMGALGNEIRDTLEKSADKKEIDKMTMCDVNASFLLDGDLVFSMAYYKNLTLNKLFESYRKNTEVVSVELEQHMIIAFWKAITSISSLMRAEESDIAAEYYTVFFKEFTYIETRLSRIPLRNTVFRLFGEECKEASGDNSLLGQNVDVQRLVLNTIANNHENAKDYSKETFDDEQEEKRRKVLTGIGAASLWDEVVVRTDVGNYLKKQFEMYVKFLMERLIKNYVVDINNANEQWDKFFGSYDGVSVTKARKAKKEIENCLQNQDKKDGISYYVYEAIIKILRELAWNSRAWYGTAQAQELLKGLQEAFFKNKESETDEKLDRYIFYFKCYYDYKMATNISDQIERDSEALKRVAENLSAAHQDADKIVLNTFMKNLNYKLSEEDQINSDEFEALFAV